MQISISNSIKGFVGVNAVIKMVKNFKARVFADGGTFEAEPCLIDTLKDLKSINLLNQASLIITPNADEEGKLFSIVPSDGAGDMNVVRATTATRVNAEGLIESVANNIPRLDYTNASCPSILVEPQRTNLQPQSNGFLSNWTKDEVTTSVGESTLISGQTTTLVTEIAINSVHRLQPTTTASLVSGTVYTISFYAKSNGTRNVGIRTGITGTSQNVIFNPNTQTAVSTPVGFTTKITAANSGYYRYEITATSAVTLDNCSICMFNGASIVYLGTSESLYVSAFQYEAGSNATSYIPTVASSVTRNADVISKTGISSLIGQTEGVIYWEGVATLQTDIIGTNRSTVNGIYITKGAGNLFRVSIYNSSNTINLTDTIIRNSNTKIAVSYKSGNISLFVNGVKVATSTSSLTFNASLDAIRLNDDYLIGRNAYFTKSVLVYKTQLTDQECINLTTL